jgi:hypothetical protein
VIGLGRPWKDSCKQCASFNNPSTTTAFYSKLDSFKTIKATSDNLNQSSLTLNRQLDASQWKSDSLEALNRTEDSVAISRLALQIRTADSIKDANNKLLAGYNATSIQDSINRMTVLAARCPYILEQTNATWFKYSPNQTGGWETVFGWIITALSISLGAPFWFDLLNKLVKLRGTGSKITTEPRDAGTSTKVPGTGAVAPVNVNVNANTGEEAVG